MLSFKKLVQWNTSKNYILQTVFLVFILLNVIDFLNIIEGDLDFFKKLLSWIIIAYIFYFVSFTNLLIGKRLPGYDILFIIAFSLMSIIKALILYSISVFKLNEESYYLFHGFLTYIASLPTALFLYITFIIGFIMTVILAISLLLNNRPKKESFIGSLNVPEGYCKYPIEQLILILMNVFFGLILFNLFMEWFALAVDSIILVIGLFYYFYLDLHDHKKARGGEYIQRVANSGNEFYTNLIKLFSDKKTIFVAISFLLTLHSVVDAGVYLVPYSTGTESKLYFNSFEVLGYDQHTPIFNFFNYKESIMYLDLMNSNGDLVLISSIFISYIVTFIFFFSFMLLPFYIFYNNVRKVRVRFKKIASVVIISSFLYYLFLVLLPGTHPPLIMKTPELDTSIRGIDIISLPMTVNSNPYELVSLSLIYVVVLIFLLFRYYSYEAYFSRILKFFVLVFFLIYITSFAGNFVQVEYEKLKTDVFEFEEHKAHNEEIYSKLFALYQNQEYYKAERNIKVKLDDREFVLRPFSDISLEDGKITKFQADHTDMLLVTLYADENFFMKIRSLDNIYFQENSNYEIRSNNYIVLSEGEIRFIYILGKNHFELVQSGEVYKVDKHLDEKTITGLFIFTEPSAREALQKAIEYIRLTFTGLFYVFGILAFTFFFLRRNFIDSY